MTQPLFSILIANYNNGQYLMTAIDSVRQQSYANWEVILVDDCSTDNSGDLYCELEKDERIHIYHNEHNGGCGYTKARCAELANGEYCGFLDPDDVLLPEALEKHAAAHQAHPEVSVVYSKAYYCDPEYHIHGEAKLPEFKKGETYFDYRTWGSMHFTTYKNCFYKQTAGINPQLKAGVDQDLYFRMEEVGNIYALDEFCYKWVNEGHAHSVSNNSKGNYAKLWYWNMVARLDACHRRGLPEDILLQDFKKVLDDYAAQAALQKEKEIRASKAYKLGKTILSIFKH